jgi:biotin-(acetyl-CoA carboxylase) ligase
MCQSFQQGAKDNLDVFRESYDFCKDKRVNVLLDDQQSLQGVVKGVSDAAELLVMVDGKECAFNSAEVSVKADT